MKSRKRMEYGYKAWTGVVFSNTQVDAYNHYQDRIDMITEFLGRTPERMLNGSRNLFWSITRPTKKGWE